ncbi:MAG: ester cyclase [Thermomicrobiales bacterium]
MSLESTRTTMTAYLEHDDMSRVAEDAVYRVMGTGYEAVGRDGVRQLLRHFYQEAFDARAQTLNVIYAEDHAVLEADFICKHIGNFAGIEPTGQVISVPMCVVYDLAGDQIRRARIYFETDALFRQLRGAFI